MNNGTRVQVSRAAYVKYAQKNNKVSKAPVFEKMEIEPEYPGGQKAWLRYVMMHLRYPQEALDKQVAGSVVVQFMVDEKGRVKDIKPLTHLGHGLETEAANIIRSSGIWYPGIQNFHVVKGYKQLSILFKRS